MSGPRVLRQHPVRLLRRFRGGYHLCGTRRADAGPCFTCVDVSVGCGAFSDGCGDIGVSCSIGCPGHAISDPVNCGGGGIPFQCGTGAVCKPVTCAQLGFNCGVSGDGCGGTVDCGSCTPPEVCGGGWFSRCGAPRDGG